MPARRTSVRASANAAEHEAETVARAVSQPSAPTVRQPTTTKANGGAPSLPMVSPLGSGRPLDAVTRRDLERRFAFDLTNVRLHDDARAAASADAIGARAYTFGSDIVFASGAYAPRSIAGKSLLAHELTHVAQQAGQPAHVQAQVRDWDAWEAAQQGTSDARRGDSRKLLEARIFHSHWPSPAARRAYTRAFLVEQARMQGAGVDEDWLEVALVEYERRLAEHERQWAAEAEIARRRNEELRREELIKAVTDELASEETRARAQRMMGTDLREYPIYRSTAVFGELAEPFEMMIKFVPIVGEVVMFLEGVIGQELITGKELSAGERVFDILLSLIPVAGQLLTAGKQGVKTLAAIVTRTRMSPQQVVRLVENIAELDAETAAVAQRAFQGGKLTAGEVKALRKVIRQLDEDGTLAAEARKSMGAAQSPKTLEWAKNPGGPRTLDEAIEIARSHGIDIPEDIKFGIVRGRWPEGRFAEYLQLGRQVNPNEMISWDRFYNQFEQIPVRVNPVVLESDEAIVAVFGHEMHELNSLRALFEANGGAMRAGELARLIQEGIPRNLHDEAWDVADRLVNAMRGTR